MVKKPVPEWLNSSLWSSPNPHLSPPSPRTDEVKSACFEPPPPLPYSEPPSPSSSASSAVAKGEIRDPMARNFRNNACSYYSDEDNDGSYGTESAGGGLSGTTECISRQTQLVQELSRKVINMGELRRLTAQGIPDGSGVRATVWKHLKLVETYTVFSLSNQPS